MSFMDEHCIFFTNEEESKLDHTMLHEDFKRIVERYLLTQLAEVGISEHEFCRACSMDGTSCEVNATVLEQLLAVDDFRVFKAMMIRRNVG